MIQLLKGFIRKEFQQALRDPSMRILLFVAPVIQLTIFGVAISNDVKNIRLWSQIEANDTLLRKVYEHATVSQWFLPVDGAAYEDPFQVLRSGTADVAMVPQAGGLTHNIESEEPNLQLLIDATNVIQAQSVESYLKNIVSQTAQDELKVEPESPPLTFATRVLFNPTLETAYFMVPGVMCMLMTIFTILLTSMSIAREKEMGTFEMLISAPITPAALVLGKTIPYIILGMVNVPLILALAVFGFHVPMVGSLWVLGLASFIFVCTTVSIGILLSTFTNNQQQSMMAGFLFLFPAILLSGLMFPLENMPAVMRWVAFLDPLAHFMALLRNIMLKGGASDFVIYHVSVLMGLAMVVNFVSFKRFKTTLK